MILRGAGAIWDSSYPWSIRTFLEFAAAEGILLDLVIPGILGERRQQGIEDGSRFQIMMHDARCLIYRELYRYRMHCRWLQDRVWRLTKTTRKTSLS